MEPLLRQAKWKSRVLSRGNVEPGRHQTSPDCRCLPVQMKARSTLELFVDSKCLCWIMVEHSTYYVDIGV